MKDPLGIMGSETIFVMESFQGRDVLEEFENMAKLKAGITRKTYTNFLISGTELEEWFMDNIFTTTGW